jgi:hypothetical protein
MTGLSAGATAAQAATGGIGWGTYGSRATAFKGSFVESGTQLVCGEPGKAAPTGPLVDIGLRSTAWINANLSDRWGNHPNLSEAQTAGISRVRHEVSASTDRNLHAALEYAIRAVMYPMDADINWSNRHSGSMNAAIAYDLHRIAGAANVAAIQAYASSLIQTIDSTVAASGTAPSGSFALSIDPRDSSAGTITANASAAASGPIALHNAVFTATGAATMANATAGTTYAIRAVPPAVGAPADPTGALYAAGGAYAVWTDKESWTAAGGGYAPQLQVWTPSVPGQQASLGVGPTAKTTFTMYGEDATARSTTFRPVATSSAPATSADGTLTDTFTFSTAADSAGRDNPWARSGDGDYVEVPFTVTAYQMSRAQAESQEIPQDAVSLGTVRLTTGRTGDTRPVTVSFPGTQKPGTSVTFVISYDAAAASARTKAFLPDGYAWSSSFAIPSETTIVPMRLRLRSQVAAPSTALSGTVDDTVTVEHSGLWLRDGSGKPISVPLLGEYVHYPAGIPVSATDTLPAGATVLGAVRLRVTGDGDHRASSAGGLPRNPAVPSDIAAADGGHVSWRWAVDAAALTADGHEGWVAPSVEKYGVAAQTATLALPNVTTQAAPGATPRSAQDVAVITGTLPEGGATNATAAYTVPLITDATGRLVPDAPADAKPGDLSWVCTPANQVFSNVGHGERVTQPGRYVSPVIPTLPNTMVLFVNHLQTVPTPDRPAKTIRRGTCGDKTETLPIVAVTTRASSQSAEVGDVVHDTITTVGWVDDGAKATVDVYAYPTGQAAQCDSRTHMTTLGTTAPLTAGVYPAESPLVSRTTDWTIPARASGMTIAFVERHATAGGVSASTGVCGDASELIVVHGPRVNTGGISGVDHTTMRPLVVWGLVGLVVAASAAAGSIVVARRGRAHD